MTWQFDVRTAMLLSSALTFLVGAMMLVASTTQPIAERGIMRWWVLGAISYSIGFALIGLRGWIWIGWSVVLGNGVVAVGLACFAIAMRRFFGMPEWRRRLLALVPAILATSVTFLFAVPDDGVRQGLILLQYAVVFAVCVQTLYRNDQPPSISRHMVGLLFGACMCLLLVHALTVLLFKDPIASIFAVTPITISVFVVGGLLPVLGTIAFLLMCTERNQRELETAARLDHLTGINNRGAIEATATRMIATTLRHGEPMSLMVVDIDHFKRINDELGHAAGDKALLATVQMLQKLVRSCDVLGRLGGEEFVLLMPDTDAVQARRGAERMRVEVERTPVTFFGTFRSLTVSIGVAEYRAEDGDFSRLLQRADRALYSAKHSGRNRVLVDLMAPDTLMAV